MFKKFSVIAITIVLVYVNIYVNARTCTFRGKTKFTDLWFLEFASSSISDRRGWNTPLTTCFLFTRPPHINKTRNLEYHINRLILVMVQTRLNQLVKIKKCKEKI